MKKIYRLSLMLYIVALFYAFFGLLFNFASTETVLTILVIETIPLAIIKYIKEIID